MLKGKSARNAFHPDVQFLYSQEDSFSKMLEKAFYFSNNPYTFPFRVLILPYTILFHSWPPTQDEQYNSI